MIALRALGNAEVVTATDRLTPSQEIVFAAALYLLLERPKAVSRSALAEVLWPSAPEAARHHRLRQTLLQLKHLGIPVVANRENVCVASLEVESDLDVLFIHGAGDVSRVETLQFLPGYAPRFSRAFSDWLDSKRCAVSAAATRVLLNDVRRARARGDWLKVERLALRCMEVDPFNEEAVLARAEGSAMRGAKREAVTILDRYVADLGPGTADIKLPASLMRKRIAERVPEAAFSARIERIFVGRETDMQVLTTLLNDARESRGRCGLVWGDAGIGKSRLAAELGRFAELQGVQVRRVACRRGDVHRPLSAFVELVPLLKEMRGALGCSPDTIADLQRLTQFEINPARKPQLDIDPQSIFEAIRAAIFDLIDAVSDEQCLLLVIEDVHWLDAASARILGQLADWAASRRLFSLFTSRVLETPLVNSCTHAGLARHHLGRLSGPAVSSLITEMFETTNEALDQQFLTWCQEVGDGNPFFLHELVKQWFETKQRHVIPPSISAVVRERMSRLSSAAVQVLQACSVLGQNSTLPRVERILDHEPYKLLAALQELSAGAMVSAGDVDDTIGTASARSAGDAAAAARLTTRHDFVSAVALEELGSHARAFLHRRAAEVLEQEFGEGPQQSSLVWACAFHWQQAGEADRAFLLAKRCAEQLLEVGLPGDAADAFEKVRPFCRSKADELSILDMKTSALQLAHRWFDVKESILEIRKVQGIVDRHDDYELKYIEAMWKSSFHFWEPSAARQCAECHDAPAHHRAEAAGLALKMASDQGRLALMDEIYAIVSPFLHSSDVAEMSRLEIEMIYQCDRGDVMEASRVALQFAAAARETGDTMMFSRAALNASTVLRQSGHFSEARALLLDAVKAALSLRSYAFARFLTLGLVRLNLTEGDIAAAREDMDRFAAYNFPSNDSHSEIDFVCLNTRLCLEEGKLQEAEICCAELLAKTDALATNRRAAILAVGVRLLTALDQDKPRLLQMLSELERLHLQYRDKGFQDYEAYSLYVGLSGIGDGQRAAQLLRDYVRVHRRDRSPVPESIWAVAR